MDRRLVPGRGAAGLARADHHRPQLPAELDRRAGHVRPKGEVRIGSASLGWFSPISLREVEVLDAQKQPLASIAAVTGDRSLLKILSNTSNVGRFRIDGPRLSVVLRPDGSNVEDALATYLAPKEEALRRHGPGAGRGGRDDLDHRRPHAAVVADRAIPARADHVVRPRRAAGAGDLRQHGRREGGRTVQRQAEARGGSDCRSVGHHGTDCQSVQRGGRLVQLRRADLADRPAAAGDVRVARRPVRLRDAARRPAHLGAGVPVERGAGRRPGHGQGERHGRQFPAGHARPGQRPGGAGTTEGRLPGGLAGRQGPDRSGGGQLRRG